MATTTVCFELDSDVKSRMEGICEELGMSVPTALNMFARAMVRERRLPISLDLGGVRDNPVRCGYIHVEDPDDPFYEEMNLDHVRRSIWEAENGHWAYHDLIEVDDE